MEHVRTVGIFPGQALMARPRLFTALGAALDSQLVDGTTRAPGDLAAAVVIDEPDGREPGSAVSLATKLAEGGLHCLLAGPARRQDQSGHGFDVRFASPSVLDDRLRNRVLREEAGPPFTVAYQAGDTVVATGADGPLWVSRRVGSGVLHQVARAPEELGLHDRLKDHLRAGRFLSLLPVVHFLRNVLDGATWTPPARRASFVIDDPNLHWPSYGYLRYPELAKHVAVHGYHIGIAMVPADAAFAHPAAVAAFKGHRGLSLLVHGNDHRKCELTRPRSPEEALAVAAQALRRTAAFERRHGIKVGRVMVPPHARCSEQMMRAVRAVGFEAICFGGDGQDGAGPVLAGWAPADTAGGQGLPHIRRLGFGRPPDEVVLRAFLDQPLVLSGHHSDLTDPDRLVELASLVESLGPVHWMSLSDISRCNASTRREDTEMRIRPFSRHLVVDLPEGVERVVVEAPPHPWSDEDAVRVVAAGLGGTPVTTALGDGLIAFGPGRLEITLIRRDDVDFSAVPPPRWTPWPVVRRCITEGRDRLVPLLSRPRSAHGR